MRRWLIDTTVLIDASREHDADDRPASRFLERAAREGELWSVTPVRTEMRWSMREGEARLVESILDRLFWLDVSTDLADRAGEFGRRYGRSHGLDVVDLDPLTIVDQQTFEGFGSHFFGIADDVIDLGHLGEGRHRGHPPCAVP